MRTVSEWETRIYPKVLQGFSPRLRDDVTKYPNNKLPVFGGYYIHGPNGCGKTVLAAQMYIEARKESYLKRLPGTFLFVNTYDFFEQLKAAYDDPHMDSQAVLAQFSSAAYLVMDDLASTKFTDWSLSQLQIIINNRYEELLPTVFTSNFSLEELSDVVGGDRIPSRIQRMCKIIKMK